MVLVVAVPVFAGRNAGALLGSTQYSALLVFTSALAEDDEVAIEFPHVSCSRLPSSHDLTSVPL
jgi:hypothetical protein